ncbi:MAG: hypothetical protein HY429_00660 [Candidatus Levybacteria bacterium]|nr:hypothetical protein [Candidatus Levybacteria bacterium]
MPPPVAPAPRPAPAARPPGRAASMFNNAKSRVRDFFGGGGKEGAPSAPVAERLDTPVSQHIPTLELGPQEQAVIGEAGRLGATNPEAGLAAIANTPTGIERMQEPGAREAAQAGYEWVKARQSGGEKGQTAPTQTEQQDAAKEALKERIRSDPDYQAMKANVQERAARYQREVEEQLPVDAEEGTYREALQRVADRAAAEAADAFVANPANAAKAEEWAQVHPDIKAALERKAQAGGTKDARTVEEKVHSVVTSGMTPERAADKLAGVAKPNREAGTTGLVDEHGRPLASGQSVVAQQPRASEPFSNGTATDSTTNVKATSNESVDSAAAGAVEQQILSPEDQAIVQQLEALGVNEQLRNDSDFRRGYVEMVARGKAAVTTDKPTVNLNQLTFHTQQRYAFAKENGIDIHTALSPQYEQTYLVAVQQAESTAKPVWAGGEPVDRRAIAQRVAQEFKANPPAEVTRSVAEQLQSLGVDTAKANDLQFQEMYARRFAQAEKDALQRKNNRGIVDARDAVFQATSEYNARVQDGTIKPVDTAAQPAQEVAYEQGKQPGVAEFFKYPVTGGVQLEEAKPQADATSTAKETKVAAQSTGAAEEQQAAPTATTVDTQPPQQSYGDWLKQRIADLPSKNGKGTAAQAPGAEAPARRGRGKKRPGASGQGEKTEAAAQPSEAGKAPETPEQKIARLEARIAALEQQPATSETGAQIIELFVKHPEVVQALAKILGAQEKQPLSENEKNALVEFLKLIAMAAGLALSGEVGKVGVNGHA